MDMLQEYIKALVSNIDKKNIPRKINVIFDGGAFNGGFAAGVAIYLKCMEEHKIIKVNSVSGCSIGSLLAVWYLAGCDIEKIMYLEKFMTSYKKNKNLHSYIQVINDLIDDIFSKDTENKLLGKLNGHLFISYYNIKKHKQQTVSKFKDKEHIIECILRSSHIPYIIDGSSSYKKKYMDGISPHIFSNGLPSLFIKLLTFQKCSRAFMIKSENNIHYRLLTGVADINEFFTTGKSDMCSFVGDWSYINILQLRIREILFFTIFSIIGWLVIMKSYLPKAITNSLIYNGTSKAIDGLYSDIVGRLLV
jgi:hypothetical protein